jgi:hypothetical protein
VGEPPPILLLRDTVEINKIQKKKKIFFFLLGLGNIIT